MRNDQFVLRFSSAVISMSTPSAEEIRLLACSKTRHYLNYNNANVLSKAVEEDSTYEYEVRCAKGFACGRNLSYLRYMTDFEFRRLSPSNKLGSL